MKGLIGMGKKILSTIAILSVVLVSAQSFALDGIQLIGVGAIHRGLGGSGVARPLDSTSVYLNPAGMNAVGRRFDAMTTVGFPQTSMNTTAALGNNTTSRMEGVILPSTSVVMPFLEDRMAFGVGVFTTSGFGTEYGASRLPSALTGNTYDTSSRYGLIKFIPALSLEVIENLHVGIASHINYAFFMTNSATAAAGAPQTTGRNRFDSALGIGGSLGIIYDPLEWLSLGVTYTSRQYFQKFKMYGDLLMGSLDMPQQVAAGLAITPFEGFLIMPDFRWINWSGVGTIGTGIAGGGFGWRDQYVVAYGMQYDFDKKFEVPITFRLGYNYGRSVISPSVAYSNMLFPAINEHHITGGLSGDITEKVGVDVSYTHILENTVTDNTAAPGASMKTKVDLFTVQLHVNW